MKRSELLAAAQEVEEFAKELLYERGGHQGARGSADAMFQLVALSRQIAQMQPHGWDYEFDEHGEIIDKFPIYRLDLED